MSAYWFSASGFHEVDYDLDLIRQHFLGQARVGAEEDGFVHDRVGTRERLGDGLARDRSHGRSIGADQADGVGAVFAELHEHRLAKQVAAKEHAVADLLFVERAGKIGVAEGRAGFHPKHETEPGGIDLATGRVPLEAVREAEWRVRAGYRIAS